MAVVTATVVGIAASAASAAQGFAAAAKAKKAQAKADTAAAKAMSEAKAKAEVDMYAGLNVPLDAYEADFENQLATSQQNVEALQAGDARGLAAGVGRIGAQATESGEKTRIAMGEEISDLNMMNADSKDAINQQLIGMDVAYAKEQNQRSRDAEAARAQGISQGMSGIAGVASGVGSAAPLFSQSGGDRRGAKLAAQTGPQTDMTNQQYQSALGSQNYSKKQYKDIKKNGWDFGTEMKFGGNDGGLQRYWDGSKWVQGSYAGK